MNRRDKFLIFIVFILAFLVRLFYIIPNKNIPFDYDQVEDLFLTKRIVVDKDPPAIGRAIYGDPSLHHGVFFFYFNVIPFIVFKWSPVAVASWISLFSSLVTIILYFFAKSLFKDKLTSFLAAFLAAVSFEFVQFASWISSITISIVTVPLFFYGLWMFLKGKKRALIMSSIALGLSIQSDLLFLYLIPTAFLFYILFKPRLPSTKTAAYSTLAFLLTVSTMIYTEVKLKLAGVTALLNFSQHFGDSSINFFDRFRYLAQDLGLTFSYNLFPNNTKNGLFIFAVIILATIVIYASKKTPKDERRGLLFTLFYLFSVVIMLFVGYHRQPWFLIGIVPAVSLLSAFIISKLKRIYLIIPVLLVIAWSNMEFISEESKRGFTFFKLEDSSLLSSQLNIVDYTYENAQGKPFAINTVTYPLYHNAIWDYHYNWYGERKYGFLPGWMGGDQLYPYDILPKETGEEEVFFFIIDGTYRIPDLYKKEAKNWARNKGKLISEEKLDGFIVQKWLRSFDSEI